MAIYKCDFEKYEILTTTSPAISDLNMFDFFRGNIN